MKKYFWGYLCLILLSSSCVTQQFEIRYTEPALHPVSPEVRSIGIVTGNMSNGLSGSPTGLFEAADETAILSFFAHIAPAVKQELKSSYRFTRVEIIPGLLDIKGTSLSRNEREKVRALCSAHSVESLLLLQFFDSNSALKNRTIKSKDKPPVIEATLVANARARATGLYPMDETFFMDEVFNHEEAVMKKGASLTRAKEHLPAPEQLELEAIQHLGGKIGSTLYPHDRRVFRPVFKKGNRFKQGVALMAMGSWPEASDYFLQLYHEADGKGKRRAAFNMAVIQEHLGNIEGALSWVKRYQELCGGLSDFFQDTDPYTYERQLNSRL